MVPIRRRPRDVEDRASRYVLLVPLPDGRTAAHVRAALTRQVTRLPADLRRTFTWDQGKEMADHIRFSIDTDVQVYFCDTHRPWQRGSNENTNGLLRQYFPKGTDLSRYSADALEKVAAALNSRPRKALDWKTPAEALRNHLSSQRRRVATAP